MIVSFMNFNFFERAVNIITIKSETSLSSKYDGEVKFMFRLRHSQHFHPSGSNSLEKPITHD